MSVQRKPRVLIVIENLPYPWHPRVSLEAAALRDAGYGVSVIAPMGEQRMNLPYERIDGIDVYRFSLPATSDGFGGYFTEYALAVWHIARLALKVWRREGFDVFQVGNPPDLFFPLGIFFKMLGKSFVFDQHDLTPETFVIRYGPVRGVRSLLHRLLEACEWLTYRAADAVLTPNESFRDKAINRGGVDPRRVFVVRNGPNQQRLRPVPPEPKLKRGRPYLACYVGMIHRQDGAEGALRAADWIVNHEGRRDITFAFLGKGDDVPRLKQLALELRLDDFVTFTGWVEGEEVVQSLCTADVGLSPEPQNGMNEYLTMIKVLEYMGLALPVVAFDLKETRFSAQDAAVYASPNDFVDFGRLILELLDDPEKRGRIGRRGRERMLEGGLTWDHSRQVLLGAYESVLAGRFGNVQVGAS